MLVEDKDARMEAMMADIYRLEEELGQVREERDSYRRAAEEWETRFRGAQGEIGMLEERLENERRGT